MPKPTFSLDPESKRRSNRSFSNLDNIPLEGSSRSVLPRDLEKFIGLQELPEEIISDINLIYGQDSLTKIQSIIKKILTNMNNELKQRIESSIINAIIFSNLTSSEKMNLLYTAEHDGLKPRWVFYHPDNSTGFSSFSLVTPQDSIDDTQTAKKYFLCDITRYAIACDRQDIVTFVFENLIKSESEDMYFRLAVITAFVCGKHEYAKTLCEKYPSKTPSLKDALQDMLRISLVYDDIKLLSVYMLLKDMRLTDEYSVYDDWHSAFRSVYTNPNATFETPPLNIEKFPIECAIALEKKYGLTIEGQNKIKSIPQALLNKINDINLEIRKAKIIEFSYEFQIAYAIGEEDQILTTQQIVLAFQNIANNPEKLRISLREPTQRDLKRRGLLDNIDELRKTVIDLLVESYCNTEAEQKTMRNALLESVQPSQQYLLGQSNAAAVESIDTSLRHQTTLTADASLGHQTNQTTPTTNASTLPTQKNSTSHKSRNRVAPEPTGSQNLPLDKQEAIQDLQKQINKIKSTWGFFILRDKQESESKVNALNALISDIRTKQDSLTTIINAWEKTKTTSSTRTYRQIIHRHRFRFSQEERSELTSTEELIDKLKKNNPRA